MAKDYGKPVSLIIRNPSWDYIYVEIMIHPTILAEEKTERYDVEDSTYKDTIYKTGEDYKHDKRKNITVGYKKKITLLIVKKMKLITKKIKEIWLRR